MVNKLWKREFRPQFFRVEHRRPEQFLLCQWQKSNEIRCAYLTYRWLMAAIFIIVMICSICDAGRNTDFGARYIKWYVYLTNWGFTVCTIQSMMAAIMITQQFIRERKDNLIRDSRPMPKSYKVYWVLHTTAVIISLGVTTIYWSAVYNPAFHTLDALNILLHAFNSIFMIIDFVLVAHPVRLLHCIWPVLFTVIYALFTFVYYHLGGTDRHNRPFIYPILDWREPRKSIIVVTLGLTFLLFLYFGVWLLFLLRRWIAWSLNKKCEVPQNGSVPLTAVPLDVSAC